MKYILIILVLGVAGYFGWQALQTQPDPSVPQAVVIDTTANPTPTTPVDQQPQGEIPAEVQAVDNQNVKVSFRGFGPGKEHVGSFSKLTSNLSFDETRNMSGTITVDINSMTTDNERLTGHLKSKDFFDTTKYSNATFMLNSLEGRNLQGGTAEGTFTIRGISKKVTFPFLFVRDNVDAPVTAYSATFTLNMKDFGINQTFANETIELSVVVPLK